MLISLRLVSTIDVVCVVLMGVLITTQNLKVPDEGVISNKNMDETQESEENLTTFIHDLFLDDEYVEWRKNLKNIEPCKWHSLIASLEKYDSSLERIKSFAELIYSKLVFSYIEAPDYNESQMLMVQFTVSGGMWSSLIWHCPERN